MKNWLFVLLGLIIVVVVLISIAVLINGCAGNYGGNEINENNENEANENFCGSSTNAKCVSDADCRIGGCSGQICSGAKEEQMFSTCEYRECYNAEKFGLKCRCADGKCAWVK